MGTIKLKGPDVIDWFAEQIVKIHGPDAARAKCCGPALAAVERAIARREADADDSKPCLHPNCECLDYCEADDPFGKPVPKRPEVAS